MNVKTAADAEQLKTTRMRALTKTARAVAPKVRVVAAVIALALGSYGCAADSTARAPSAFHTSSKSTIMGFPGPKGLSPQFPAGIESLGTASGKPIVTSSMTAYARIDSLTVSYNFHGWRQDMKIPTDKTASLQFNSSLYVWHGQYIYNYFVQNVCSINTVAHTMQFVDNVSPSEFAFRGNSSTLSVPQSVIAGVLRGNGTVAPADQDYSYYFYSGQFGYKLPVQIYMTDRVANGSLYLSYQIGSSRPVVFDTISMGALGGKMAFVSSAQEKKGGIYADNNDADLVFAGDGDAETAVFGSPTAAYLSMYYGSKDGTMRPFNSILQPNNVVDESAYNLRSSLSSKGLIELSTGTPVNYMDENFNPPALHSLLRDGG